MDSQVNWKQIGVQTWNEWNADEAPRMGASLAYYTVLSLAPLLIVVLAVVGFVYDREAAQGLLFYQIRDMVGDQGAEAIQTMIRGAGQKGTGILASILGFLTLAFGATSVVGELRTSLNKVWKVPPKPDAGWLDMVKERGYAFGVVLGTGFLLLVALVLSTVLAALGKFFGNYLPLPEFALGLINFAISFVVITILFALIYKVLPDAPVEWSDVWLGAAVTSLLFSIGKSLIGLYLGKASFGSTYGAAGSLVIVLVWVYYSSQIFFFGAEFTQVYAHRHGSKPREKVIGMNDKPREQQDSKHEQKQPAWQSVHAASGNAQILPVTAVEPAPSQPTSQHSFVENLAVLVGSAAALGTVVKKAFKGDISPRG